MSEEPKRKSLFETWLDSEVEKGNILKSSLNTSTLIEAKWAGSSISIDPKDIKLSEQNTIKKPDVSYKKFQECIIQAISDSTGLDLKKPYEPNYRRHLQEIRDGEL